jgi:hypothetical protein
MREKVVLLYTIFSKSAAITAVVSSGEVRVQPVEVRKGKRSSGVWWRVRGSRGIDLRSLSPFGRVFVVIPQRAFFNLSREVLPTEHAKVHRWGNGQSLAVVKLIKVYEYQCIAIFNGFPIVANHGNV